MKPELLPRIKRIVASYPDAPEGIEEYHWLSVPPYWDRITVPTGEPRGVVIQPLHEDQHAGVHFRVGWNVAERVAALWIL